jgi:toxin ParE1/3/4
MKRRIIRRPRATDDLTEQTAYYLSEAGREVASRFVRAVEETLEVVLDLPLSAPSRGYLNPSLEGLRMVQVRGFKRHVLFYRPTPEGLEFVRLLHDARDLKAILEDEV